MKAARVTVLGSGTLLPDDDRRSACYHLETASGFTGLLDCGSGALHGCQRWGVAWEALDAVVFSHYHLDHVGDLAPLLFALQYGIRPPRERPFALVGPPGLRDVMEGIRAAFGSCVEERTFPFAVRELERTDSWRAGGPDDSGQHPGTVAEVRFHPTPHTDGSVAHRWTVGERVIAYTGDTGPPDDDLAAFLSGADLLVAECALPDGTDMQNHLTPDRVARLARRARPGMLLTTHAYPPLVPEEVPERVREAGYDGVVVAARDGMVVDVGADGAKIAASD